MANWDANGWGGDERRTAVRRFADDRRGAERAGAGRRKGEDRRRQQHCFVCGNVFKPGPSSSRVCPSCRSGSMGAAHSRRNLGAI